MLRRAYSTCWWSDLCLLCVGRCLVGNNGRFVVQCYNVRRILHARKTGVQLKACVIIRGVNQHTSIAENAPRCRPGLLSHAAVQTFAADSGLDVWIMFITDITGSVIGAALEVIQSRTEPTPGSDSLMRTFRGWHIPGKA